MDCDSVSVFVLSYASTVNVIFGCQLVRVKEYTDVQQSQQTKSIAEEAQGQVPAHKQNVHHDVTKHIRI